MPEAPISQPESTPHSANSDELAPAEQPRFAVRMRGYDRDTVDAWADASERRTTELQTQVLDKSARIASLEGQLKRVRRELRYWQDRDIFIEAEIERARDAAERIERDAAARAERIERDAADRAQQLEADAHQAAMQLVERVSSEADAILERAREESRVLVDRNESDLELSRRRLHRLSRMQVDVVQAIRTAMSRFEHGLAELELVTPSARAAHEAEQRAVSSTGATSGTLVTTSTADVIDTRNKLSITAKPASRVDPAVETARTLARGAAAGITP